MDTQKSHAEHYENNFIDLFTESHDVITQQKICNGGHTQNQMELPKLTGRHAKKYIAIFFMILACVIISIAVSSVLSTKNLIERLPSEVEEQLRKGEFFKQTVFNVSNGELKNHIDSLQSDMRTDMENFSNKTNLKIEQLLHTLPNKTDFDVWKEESKGSFFRLYHAMRCITDCKDHRDGNYQSCFTCTGFIACSNGKLWNRQCAQIHENIAVYWDDFKKLSVFKSSTCDSLHVITEDESN